MIIIKYVVYHKYARKWLTNSYYKTNDGLSKNILDAHLFSAFELKLASITRLREKDKYVVYSLKEIISRGVGLLDEILKTN